MNKSSNEDILKEFDWEYVERMVGKQSDLEKAFWEGYILSALEKAREEECMIDVGNKTCKGNTYRICSSHLDKLVSGGSKLSPEKREK